MGHYRHTEDAKADLIRIHHYGVLGFGETQAEKYRCFGAIEFFW